MTFLSKPGTANRPKRYYSVWTDGAQLPGEEFYSRVRSVTVYVQLSPEAPPVMNLEQGRIVAIIRRGLRKGSAELRAWMTYAENCCRGWQACRDVADLAGLEYFTLPGILADRAAELGRADLEATLRCLYDLPGFIGRASGPTAIIPELPDDEGGSIGLIQGEGAGL